MSETNARFSLSDATPSHLGLIVEDLDRCVALWEGVAGVGPWRRREVTLERALRGQMCRYYLRLGFADLGPTVIEAIEPHVLAGASVHREYLDAKGEGIQHIGFVVSDPQAMALAVGARGVPVLMEGPMSGGDGYFVYLDGSQTSDVIVELTTNFTKSRVALDVAGQIPRLTRIGGIVRDAEKSAKQWSAAFGLGPWRFQDTTVQNAVLRDRVGDFSVRLALAPMGPLELKLCQPIAGNSVQQEYLDKYGEGLNQLQFSVDDLEGYLAEATQRGARVAMRGCSSQRPGGFAFLEPINGTYLEINGTRPLANGG